MLALLLSLQALGQGTSDSWLQRFQRAEAALEAGALDDAAAGFEGCFEWSPENTTTAYHLACVHARAGRSEDAFLWLERAVDWGWMDGAVIAWDPDLAPLRANERFDALVARAASNPEAEGTQAELVTGFGLRYPHISADAERLLTTGPDHGFLWDLATAELLAVMPLGSWARFGFSGELIVTMDGRSDYRVWDGRTGVPLGPVEAEDFPGGLRLPARGVGVWFEEGALSSPKGRLAGLGPTVDASEGLAVSPDGTRVLAVDREFAKLYGGGGRDLIARIPMLGLPKHHVGFAPDGRTAYLASGRGVVQWIDATDGSVLKTIETDPDNVLKCVAFADARTLVTVQIDRLVRWRRVGSGAAVREWRVPAEGDVRFDHADVGRGGTRLVARVSGRAGQSTYLWDCDEETPIRCWADVSGWQTRFTGDNQLVVQLDKDQLELVEATEGRTLWTSSRVSGDVPSRSVDVQWPRVLADDETVLVPVSDGTVRAFDLATGATSYVLTGPEAPIDELDVTPDGAFAAASSEDGSAYVWDLRRRERVATFSNAYGGGKWRGIAIHPEGDRIVTWGEGSPTRVWSVESGSVSYELAAFGAYLAWSPDGAFLASAEGRRVRMCRADTGQQVGVSGNHPGAVQSLAISPDSTVLATGSDAPLVRLWSVPGGELQYEVSLAVGVFPTDEPIGHLAWTERGDLLATTLTQSFCIDVANARVRWKTLGFGPYTLYSVPSPSGTRAYVSGGTSYNAKVVDVESGEELTRIGDRGLWDLTGTRDDRLVIGQAAGDTVVMSGSSLRERYRRVEHRGGEALVITAALVHAGERRAVHGSYLAIGTDAYPLDGFAPVLYDPKRVLASAAGVPLRRPVLPEPPRVVEVEPAGRRAHVSADAITVVVRAEAASAVPSFQLERDGRVLPAKPPGVETERTGRGAVLKWTLRRPDSGETHLRIRAVGESGLSSRPALLTLDWG